MADQLQAGKLISEDLSNFIKEFTSEKERKKEGLKHDVNLPSVTSVIHRNRPIAKRESAIKMIRVIKGLKKIARANFEEKAEIAEKVS